MMTSGTMSGIAVNDTEHPIAIPVLFSGETAVVTGAAQGLGLAFARALAVAGCKVLAVDSQGEAVARVAGDLRDRGLRCEAIGIDIQNPAQCASAAEACNRLLGDAMILVNNAGVTTRVQLDDDNFMVEVDRVMGVNVNGVLNVTRAFMGQLKQSKGTIVNVASIAGLLASFASVPYAASKGAVVQITRFLARDLAPFGVRVNALAPGFVLTPLTADLRDGAASRMERSCERTMLKRVATPDDLVGPLLFLASSLSRYITGVVLPVDGGYSAT